jgi:hypothetical protein
MPWIGYPETAVTQLTFAEWVFSLRARREVQIGYSVRVAGAWELFGDDKWLWFTGAVRSSSGGGLNDRSGSTCHNQVTTTREKDRTL